MNVTERRGIVAAAIAVTIGLIIVVIGVLIDGGGDSIDVAGLPEQATIPSPTDPQAPDQPGPPAPTQPPQGSQPPGDSVPPVEPSAPSTTLPPRLPLRPGEGVEVIAARSKTQPDAVPAEVTSALLRELGFQVSPPADLELVADQAYRSLAAGDTDIWIAGRYPLDEDMLKQDYEDSTIGDLVAPLGELAVEASKVGLAIDRATVDELGITTLQGLLADPVAVERYDRDGNGRPDVMVCQGDPRCDEFIDLLDEDDLLDGIDLVDQPSTNWGDAVIEEFRAGQPVLFVHSEPHWLASILLTGGDIVWLSLGTSSPASAEIDSGECSDDPCRLGAQVNDLRSVVNVCFVDENPAAEALVEAVTFDPLDLAVFDAEVRSGRDPFGVSAVWLEQHRAVVDPWLAAARLAAVQTEPEPCDGEGGAANPA
ncbi:MAG: hypothetical protein IH940_03585 [Acidobacteria bacterium]|nr:hypothetical protein [Acidobacteriota bacterium]